MSETTWRRTAARLVVAVVIATGLVPLLSGAAWACSCVGYSSEDEQYRQAARTSKVIYTGLITQKSQPSPTPGTEPQPPPDVRYTVEVEEDLKGGASGTREISTSESSASCGIELTPGRRALLVEYAGDRRVGLCDGTTQDRVDQRAAIVRDEVRRQGEPDPAPPPPGSGPAEPDPPSLPRTGGPAGLGALAAVVTAAAVAAVSTRRLR